MTFPHPLRGTCVPECESYGFCHCGCGRRTRLSGYTHYDKDRVKGFPSVYWPSHNIDPTQVVGCWGSRGIPVERVQPLARWLVKKYGWEVPGIPESTIAGILCPSSKGRRVSPNTARRVVELVEFHRRARDPWAFTEEEERRLPHQRVQEEMEDVVRRERERVYTAARRKRIREARVG